MQQQGNTRRLTTVLATDVVSYSKMTGRNEEHTIRLVRQRFATVTTFVQQHDGRVFNTAGDALLAEFASPVEAVRCAIEVQEAMRTANQLADEADRLQLRIGINLGDVIVSGSDLLGDGVNIAARLESLAPAGGICVSASVYDQLVGKLTLGAEDLGNQQVKNIERPIRAYRLTAEGAPPVIASPPPVRLKARIVIAVLSILVGRRRGRRPARDRHPGRTDARTVARGGSIARGATAAGRGDTADGSTVARDVNAAPATSSGAKRARS